MRKIFIDRLLTGNHVTSEQHAKILGWLKNRPFSLHWELRTILYTGVLLLTSGLGIIIYKHIDTIGHTAIIFAIAASCAGCFYYCYQDKLPWSHEKVKHASPWFHYVLLLGCLLFLALEGYLQYQYSIFGIRYGLATLIPALLFFFLAFSFDHIGVLSLGITALASFAGVSVSPGMLIGNQLSEVSLIYTGAALAVFLIVSGYFLKEWNIKKHFTFTWYNFGFNMYFICMLAGLFTLDFPYIYFAFHILGCLLLARYAIREKSFYFLLLPVIYGYISFTWAMFQLGLDELIGLYYFVISCIGIIWFFLNYRKILKMK